MGATDGINVSPDQLRTVSPQFRTAAQDTLDLVSRLDGVTRNLISDMYSTQLAHAPDALDTLWRRWYNSLTTLSSAMQTVADNLDAASGGYQVTDQNAMH